MLSAPTDGRRQEKLFAGRKRKQSAKGGQGKLCKAARAADPQPSHLLFLVSLALIGSPVCSPCLHVVSSCFLLSSLPLSYWFLSHTFPFSHLFCSLFSSQFLYVGVTFSSSLPSQSGKPRQAGRQGMTLFFSPLHPISSLFSCP